MMKYKNSGASVDSATGKAGRRTIVFFDHTAELGGGEIALLHLVWHLDKEQYEPVVVLCSHGPLVEQLTEAGIETHVVPLAPSVVHTRKDHLNRHALTRLRDLARVVAYCLRLAVFLRRRNAELLHTNSLKADIIGGVAGRIARIPVLWHVRDRVEDDYLPPKVVRLFRWLSRILPKRIITNSAATLATLRLPASAQPRGNVVHDGIPINDNDDKQESTPVATPEPNLKRIGIVGRISPWKGQHIFLAAAARVHEKYPGVSFQIIGEAMFGEEEYKQELLRQTDALNLTECVEWLGFRTDVPQLIRQLDILVHASTTGEPFGQVVIEGMVEGKPVIATRGGGIPEIIEDGINGVLVPMNDESAMAEAMLRLLREPSTAQAIGRAARLRVTTHFGIERTVRQVEKVYNSVLGHSPE